MTLQKIYHQTVEIEKWIESYDRDRREDWITRLQELLNARDSLTSKLTGRCPDDQRALGEKVVEMNRRIDAALQSVRQDIMKDMSRFRHRKQTVSRYRNPYTGPTKDGMYLDKRE